jgi:NitT/TauT family transport system permease protein
VRSLRGLAGLLAVLASCEAVTRVGLVDARFVPPPSVVLVQVAELLGREAFLRDVIATVLAWAIALGTAVVIAVPAGLVLGSVPAVRVATRALVELLRPIPSVALIPLVILLVGGGPEAKITLAVYASIWPILYNTVYGLDEIDPLLIETARACGTPRLHIATSVTLPCAAPFVVTGVRLSAAIALIVVVSTEFLAGASRGIGSTILRASSGAGRMDVVLAATLVAGAIGFAINEGLERLARRAFPWSAVAGAS